MERERAAILRAALLACAPGRAHSLDFITSVCSVEARLDSIASTTEGSGEGAEHDHSRSGLSSQRSAGSVFRYGDGRDRERRLNHSDGEAERFYRDLQRRQVKVRVGIEATGHARWFVSIARWSPEEAESKALRSDEQLADRRDETG
jgi:hypothetical protein